MRRHLTYANVTATLALFVALGGSSYAAIKVTGRDVRDGSLSGRDLRAASLSSREVRNGSLMTSDFHLGQLPSGERGEKGEKGDRGDPGPPGATQVVMREGSIFHGDPPPPGDSYSRIDGGADCEPGERATGGGYYLPAEAVMTRSEPVVSTRAGPPADGSTPGGWAFDIDNPSRVPLEDARLWVVCARP